MSMWRNNNQAAMGQLMDACAGASATLQQNRQLERQLKAQREGYAAALERAKLTGEMPLEYQRKVGIDELTGHMAVKIVALRELGKMAGDRGHPLLRQTVRSNIGKQAVINYYRSNPTEETDLDACAPSDQAAQIIFALPDHK